MYLIDNKGITVVELKKYLDGLLEDRDKDNLIYNEDNRALTGIKTEADGLVLLFRKEFEGLED